MSSRNNNFSNRAQKAKLTVLQQASNVVPPPVNVQAVPIETNNPNSASMRVSWASPGTTEGHVDSDTGECVWGMDHNQVAPAAYSVQYSLDGGASWNAAACWDASTTCDVKNLPAG